MTVPATKSDEPHPPRSTAARGQVDDATLVRALADPSTYPGHPQVRLVETHASWVFVAGERVYKVKKPVAFDFLDYSTLARRRAACREELRVNSELAPDVYRGVRAVVQTPRGLRFAPEDAPAAIEYAVEMKRFREQDTLEGTIAAGALTHDDVCAVAARIESFHRSAELIAGGGVEDVVEHWRSNVRGLERLEHPSGWRADVVREFGESFADAHAPEIEQRAQAGLVRDGHGDLRCEHVLIRPSVRIVDRIEFDPGMRQVDVACDLAFLAMDLEAHGTRWAARRLVSDYRRLGGDPGSDPLRAFYAAHWSLVRAKVALIAEPARAERWWQLAERLCWRARRPLAILVCGPPASGKSVLAAELSRRSRMPVVSSDEVRKRRAGIALAERAGPERYRDSFTRGVYEQVSREALSRVHAHGGVIVDASCGSRVQRALLLRRLERVGSLRLVVQCEVPVEVALRRAAQRMADEKRVSDATPQVVAELHAAFEPLDELPAGALLRLDTRLEPDEQLAVVTRAVDQRLGRRRSAPGDGLAGGRHEPSGGPA